MSQYNDQTPGDEFYLTVEDYYGIKMNDGSMSGVAGEATTSGNKISFQQFVE